MYNPAYLSLSRHNIYYFRYPIPAFLHPQGRKTDIRLSLETRCPNEALRLMRNLVYVADSIIQHPAIRDMEFSEIRAVLHHHFKAERDKVKARIAKLGQLQAHEIAIYQSGQERAAKAVIEADYSAVGRDEDLAQIIESQNLSLGTDDPAYAVLRAEYAKAFRDYCASVLEYNSRFDGFQFKTNPQALALKQATREGRKKKLTDAIEEYITEKLRYEKWTAITAEGFRAQLDLMAEYLGPDASIHVSKDTAVDVKRMLEHIPQRARSLPEYADKSLPELMEIEGAKKLSPESINKYLRTYTGFFEWAVNLGHTDENNFKGLVTRLRKDEQARDDFTDAQIKTILDAVLNNHGGMIRKQYQKWGVLIAIYTGARLNEIAQLTVDDIIEQDGVWCFSFNDDEEKTLKNVHSNRNVPIHSRLLELGILGEVERVRKMGKARFLFELTRFDPNYGYGRNLGRWVNERFLNALGMKSPRLVFHSFQHTVITRLLQAGIDDPVVKTICGHSMGRDVTQRVYNKGYKPSQLKDAIERIGY